MKVSVQTESLKLLVSKAVAGASSNKMIPLSQLMCISIENNEIVLITTDGNNYFYVFDNIDTKENFYAVVEIEQFSKLISKLTCDIVELSVDNNVLTVAGNGTYNIELRFDEDGEPIVYPDPYTAFINDGETQESGTISADDLQIVTTTLKASVSNDDKRPTLMNYYVNDKIVATNRHTVASYSVQLFNRAVLLSQELMEFMSTLEGDIEYQIYDDVIVLESDDVAIYGILSEADNYPIDMIDTLINEDFESTCTFNKQDLLALLDRMSLFVGQYDDKAISLYFEKDGLRVTNKSNTSDEFIAYESSKKHKKFDCSLDVEMFMSQIRAYGKDVVQLQYGRENTIKLINDKVVQLISLNIKQ